MRWALVDAGVLTWTERYIDPYLDGRTGVAVRGPEWPPSTYSIEELHEALDLQGVVMGHLSLRAFMDAGVDRCWALVREPRSRLVSRYAHALAHPAEVERFGPGSSFDAFLSSPAFAFELDNFEARMLLPSMTPPDAVIASGPRRFRRRVRRELRSVRERLAGVVWSTQIDTVGRRLLADVGAPPDAVAREDFPRENVSATVGEGRPMAADVGSMLEALTWRSTIVLEELMRMGLLAHRSRAELDAEFHRTLTAHGFLVD